MSRKSVERIECREWKKAIFEDMVDKNGSEFEKKMRAFKKHNEKDK